MEIPYYGDVSVDGEPFCADCNYMDLTITTDKVWADFKVGVLLNRIECSNINKCRRLYKKMNPEVQNNTTKESEEKS